MHLLIILYKRTRSWSTLFGSALLMAFFWGAFIGSFYIVFKLVKDEKLIPWLAFPLFIIICFVGLLLMFGWN